MIFSETYWCHPSIINAIFTDLEYGQTIEMRHDGMGSTIIIPTIERSIQS